MEEIKDLQIIKREEFCILQAVSSFCKKHNISYFLFYGSLLGALRHKGFIPWDDDIDIAMPRPDYELFLKIFHSKKFYVSSCERNPNYPFPFAKVSIIGTLKKEPIVSKFQLGINIDIFPLDYCDYQFLPEKIQKHRLNLIKKHFFLTRDFYSANSFRDFFKNFVLFFKKISLKSSYSISVELNCKAKTLGSVISPYLICFCDSSERKPVIFPKSFFFESSECFFEKTFFAVPNNSDGVLKILYGDYKMLPPIEKRQTHHEYKIYFL